MRAVHVELTCSVEECGQTLALGQDHLPPGWFAVGVDLEVCPRHKPRIEVDPREPGDDVDEAIKEHFALGFDLDD